MDGYTYFKIKIVIHLERISFFLCFYIFILRKASVKFLLITGRKFTDIWVCCCTSYFPLIMQADAQLVRSIEHNFNIQIRSNIAVYLAARKSQVITAHDLHISTDECDNGNIQKVNFGTLSTGILKQREKIVINLSSHLNGSPHSLMVIQIWEGGMCLWLVNLFMMPPGRTLPQASRCSLCLKLCSGSTDLKRWKI